MKSLLQAIVMLLICAVTGCTSVKLALNDQNWANQPENVVQGRNGFTFNQSIRFAGFATDKVKRSWTRTSATSRYFDFSNITQEFITRHQAYSFNIHDSIGHAFTVSCAINVRKTDMNWQKNTSSGAYTKFQSSDILGNNIHILISNPADEEDLPWQMTLNNNAHLAERDRAAGTLYQSEDDYYYFMPLTQMKGTDGRKVLRTADVIGYEIFNQDNEPVAAVSLLNKGAVYFKTQAPAERLLLAGVCSALLLQPHDVED